MNAQTAPRSQAVVDFASAQPAPPTNIVPFVPPPAEMPSYPPKIAKALVAITREMGAVAKSGWNDFHKYHYQKWEDVLERVSGLLGKHGIIIQQSEVGRSLFENEQIMSITYEFSIINEDGEAWPDRPRWTSIARARDSKGVPDDKAANKAHTQAHKYFLLHLFKIKTKETAADDSDGDNEQAAVPKPPKPGSTEAQAIEGPRPIPANGHTATSWTDAFLLAIKGATPADLDKWIEANRNSLDKIGQYPDEARRISEAVTAIKSPVKPKPPKPGAAPAPATKPMPNPGTDAAGWIAWLGEKFAAFETYETGEKYWNDTVEPTLDGLAQATQEDAMSIWQRFETRFEP